MIIFTDHKTIDYITLETKEGQTYPLIKYKYHYDDNLRFDKFILPNPSYTNTLKEEDYELLSSHDQKLYDWYNTTGSIFNEINKQNRIREVFHVRKVQS